MVIYFNGFHHIKLSPQKYRARITHETDTMKFTEFVQIKKVYFV